MTAGSMQTDTVIIKGDGSADVDCYYACPVTDGPIPGVVVLQHIFGVDEWIIEVCRKLAHFGYAAIAPNFYARIGSLGSGAAEDLGARLRSLGGLNDKVVTGDIKASVDYLNAQPGANGRVGTIGFCMGGLHGYAAACRIAAINATIDCWGGNVAPDEKRLEQMAAQGMTFAPVQETASITAPLLGIFGVEDRNPNLAELDRTEEALKAAGKDYEFHRYDGAGHAFMDWHSASYRREQSMDAWKQVFAFFDKHLSD